MTRKDYQKIAEAFRYANAAIKNGHLEKPEQAMDFAIRQMAIILKNDNPRFDMERFSEACSPYFSDHWRAN